MIKRIPIDRPSVEGTEKDLCVFHFSFEVWNPKNSILLPISRAFRAIFYLGAYIPRLDHQLIFLPGIEPLLQLVLKVKKSLIGIYKMNL